MLKEQAKLFSRLLAIVDFALLIVAMTLAHFLLEGRGGGTVMQHLGMATVAFPVWCFLLARYGLYSSLKRRGVFDILTSLLTVHLWGGGLLAGLLFLVAPSGVGRTFFVSFILLSYLLFALFRFGIRFGSGYLPRGGAKGRNIIVVGAQEKGRDFYQLLLDHSDWGLNVIGFVQVDPDPSFVEVKGQKVLGRVEDLIEICKGLPVDEVVFCPPKHFVVDAEAYLKDLEELGITVRMVLDFYEVSRSRRELNLFHDEVPILTYHSKTFDAQELFLKRLLDIAGALVGLSISALLLPFIAFAIKKDSPGPLFFGQKRVGESGRIFKCWKFRSMYIDAEERKKDLMDQNEMNGAIFKMKNDPRITKVGDFLRKTSLDELPQFWNVLVGEMSLVGTRPPTPNEVAEYENWHRRRISIKSGITGNWQVSGRNKIEDFDDIVRLDLEYIDNWSFWLDIKILIKTVKVVFAREGSC